MRRYCTSRCYHIYIKTKPFFFSLLRFSFPTIFTPLLLTTWICFRCVSEKIWVYWNDQMRWRWNMKERLCDLLVLLTLIFLLVQWFALTEELIQVISFPNGSAAHWAYFLIFWTDYPNTLKGYLVPQDPAQKLGRQSLPDVLTPSDCPL